MSKAIVFIEFADYLGNPVVWQASDQFDTALGGLRNDKTRCVPGTAHLNSNPS